MTDSHVELPPRPGLAGLMRETFKPVRDARV